MKLLDDGSYAIDDRLNIPGDGISPFVFCAGWLLEIIEIESGEFSYVSDGKPLKPEGNRFGAFYPSFSIVHSYVNDLRGSVRGVGGVEQIEGLPAKPIIFETDQADEFTSAEQAIGVIRSARNIRSIESNSDPSILSIRAKRLIDENYAFYPSIAKIAKRINVSHAHLSRQFKRDYQMSPSEYLHHLRTADATFRLSLGHDIIKISQDVGYNDLSRFYKQFKKQTATSPGACRTMLEEGNEHRNIKKRQDHTHASELQFPILGVKLCER
jgi:AraC-like DNA-binding protein